MVAARSFRLLQESSTGRLAVVYHHSLLCMSDFSLGPVFTFLIIAKAKEKNLENWESQQWPSGDPQRRLEVSVYFEILNVAVPSVERLASIS